MPNVSELARKDYERAEEILRCLNNYFSKSYKEDLIRELREIERRLDTTFLGRYNGREVSAT